MGKQSVKASSAACGERQRRFVVEKDGFLFTE